jgi:hypothetical protein
LSGYFDRRSYWIAVACAFLAAPWAASAGETGPDPRTLGLTEGLLQYCSKSAPSTTVGYREKIMRLVQGVSEQELARVRASAEYLQARSSLEEFTSQVDEHNAKRMCANGLKTQQAPQ